MLKVTKRYQAIQWPLITGLKIVSYIVIMDISALWKAQTYEQHSLIPYCKQRMQTSYLRTGY